MGFLAFPLIDLFLFFLRCLFLLGRAGAILYQERCVMVVVVFGGWWWRRTKGMDGLLVQREGEEEEIALIRSSLVYHPAVKQAQDRRHNK